MKYVLLLAALLCTVSANAQKTSRYSDTPVVEEGPPISDGGLIPASHFTDTINGTVYQYIEQMPAAGYDYAGYINRNLHYPDSAKKKSIQGRVIIRFIVNEDGSLTNYKIIRRIGGGCDEEALRVVKTLPPWEPGKQNGKPVKVNFTLPVVFRLTNE